MDAMLYIAAARQTEMQAVAATERLASQLRHDRPRRSLTPAITALATRLRGTATAAPAPCPTC